MNQNIEVGLCHNLLVNKDSSPPLACRDGFTLNAKKSPEGKIVYQVPQICPIIKRTQSRVETRETSKVNCFNVSPPPSHKDLY